MQKPTLLLVDAAILPEGYLKVAQAKLLLKDGKAKNLAEAARMAGISRSTFYKYRDHVFTYNERSRGKMLTVHVVLHDRPGVLSGLLTAIYKAGANVLTLNQNIPVSGFASVSLSIRIEALSGSPDELINKLKSQEGVHSVEQILAD